MIELARNPYYNTLKEGFLAGMNGKHFQAYCDRLGVSNVGKNRVTKLHTQILYDLLDRLIIASKRKQGPVHTEYSKHPDCGIIKAKIQDTDELERLPRIKSNLIPDTLNKGRSTPLECFVAWYDALAEYAAIKAYDKVGEKEPIPVINEELNRLQERLSLDEGFLIAKEELVKSLRNLFPTDHEKILQECQQSFNDKIEATISDIVAIVTGKSSISAKK